MSEIEPQSIINLQRLPLSDVIVYENTGNPKLELNAMNMRIHYKISVSLLLGFI